MSETVEWDVEEAIEMTMEEGYMQHEVEAEERKLKWAHEMIENREAREQASKVSREVLAKQAKMLEQGRNPAECVYDDDYEDDDYDADEWYLDDECYPDDE